MMADVLEIDILLKMGNKTKARTELDQVLQTVGSLPEPPGIAVGLALSRACLAQNRTQEAEQLTRQVLKSRHDDPQLAARVTRIFKEHGREDDALRLIESTAADIVELNNQAVMLAQGGDLAGSAERFLAAVKDMPDNLQVMLNAVNALLALVNRQGWHASYMQHAHDLLQRIQSQEPTNGRALQLAEIFRKTQRRFGVQA